MMVFDVVATLGGVAIATLGGDVGRGGGKSSWPDIIVESWRIVARCLSLALAVVRIIRSSCLKKSATTKKVLSCADVTGTWRLAGYSCHVSTKQKHQVDGM